MRQKWTSLILHTTALIHQKKQALLTSHTLGSLGNMLVIIVLEIFLALISLPLYIVTKPAEKSKTTGQTEYKIRRVITLTTLTIVVVIWLLKLSFIATSWYFFDIRSTFAVHQLSSEEVTATDLVTEFAFSAAGSKLLPPSIAEVSQQTKDTFAFFGTAEPEAQIMLYLSKPVENRQSKLLWNVLAVTADSGGQWSLTQDRSVSYLSPGKYVAVAVTFDEALEQRSELSNVISFEIQQDFWQKVFASADIYLNILMLIFLVLGAFLITLTV
jgi:hypothetical protein